jgi:predicted TIM-barrel fold metal-dependent hydrolase
MLGKHQNVFADISGLLTRSWQAYNTLVNAYQYGVIEKLLFGSDFPYTTASDTIEALYSLNQMIQGTALPAVPREQLRGIVERDTVGLLGITL